MNKTSQLVLFTLFLALPTSGQQVASLDLRRPAPVEESPKSAEDTKSPGGCGEHSLGSIVDGITQSDDEQPRPIRVSLTNVRNLKFQLGSEIEATVQLLNSGKQSIQIPWNTYWDTTTTGQDPDERTWQVGEFRVLLKGRQHTAELKGLSQILYASRFVPGSVLTLKPGEWITAQINFMVEVSRPAYMEIDEGDAELSVEWFQTTRSRVEKDCRVSIGYFPYKSYEQENPPVSVEVAKTGRDEGKEAPTLLE